MENLFVSLVLKAHRRVGIVYNATLYTRRYRCTSGYTNTDIHEDVRIATAAEPSSICMNLLVRYPDEDRALSRRSPRATLNARRKRKRPDGHL